MRILVLDDNLLQVRAPNDYVVEPHDYREDYIVQVARPSVFWDQYYKGGWDELWLDHDLGKTTYNGRFVSKGLSKLYHEGQPVRERILVITMNPIAGDHMISDLTHKTDIRALRWPISILNDNGVTRGDLITDRSSVTIINNPKER